MSLVPGKIKPGLVRVLKLLVLTVVLINDHNFVCIRRFSDIIPCHCVCFCPFQCACLHPAVYLTVSFNYKTREDTEQGALELGQQEELEVLGKQEH